MLAFEEVEAITKSILMFENIFRAFPCAHSTPVVGVESTSDPKAKHFTYSIEQAWNHTTGTLPTLNIDEVGMNNIIEGRAENQSGLTQNQVLEIA